MMASANIEEVTRQDEADLQQLQGVWTSVAGRIQARLTVTDAAYEFELADGRVYSGTFTVDANAEPRRIAMFVKHGPTSHQDLLFHCIYKFQDDLLCWCPPRPGSCDLLPEFPAVDDPFYLSLRFERFGSPREMIG